MCPQCISQMLQKKEWTVKISILSLAVLPATFMLLAAISDHGGFAGTDNGKWMPQLWNIWIFFPLSNYGIDIFNRSFWVKNLWRSEQRRLLICAPWCAQMWWQQMGPSFISLECGIPYSWHKHRQEYVSGLQETMIWWLLRFAISRACSVAVWCLLSIAHPKRAAKFKIKIKMEYAI